MAGRRHRIALGNPAVSPADAGATYTADLGSGANRRVLYHRPPPWPTSQPLHALHYDPARAGDARRPRRAALRRDRPRAARRARRALALQRRRARPAAGRRRRPLRARRAHAGGAGARRAWSSATPSPRCGRTPRTTPGPDGRPRTRHGFFARVRVEEYGAGPDPPARAHPSRAQGGSPAADAGHARQPLADLLAPRRPGERRLGGARAAHRRRAAGRRRPTRTARATACGASATATRSQAVRAALAEPSC